MRDFKSGSCSRVKTSHTSTNKRLARVKATLILCGFGRNPKLPLEFDRTVDNITTSFSEPKIQPKAPFVSHNTSDKHVTLRPINGADCDIWMTHPQCA